MTITDLLEKIRANPETIVFSEVIALIDEHYDFTPTSFQNGDTHNEVGKNSGSCKIFSFAKMNLLNKVDTLACFGAFYKKDVLENPDGTDHQNIRNFMIYGWEGIKFESDALILK
jgi:HopJ type III effector protein